MLFSGVLIEPPTAWHHRGYRAAPERVLHLLALARCSANHLQPPLPSHIKKKSQNKTKRDRDGEVTVFEAFRAFTTT